MLELENVRKLYGNGRGLKKLSLKVEEGSICGILGSNGCGKTTTFRLLLGLLHTDAGTILYDGKGIEDRVSLFGYLPEERSMMRNLSVVQQVVYLGRLKKMSSIEIHQALDYWLEYLDIQMYRKQKIMELSKGNQQKVQIICALIHNPKIVILDEPFNGLDVDNVELFKELLFKLKKEKKIILISSHQYNNIEDICDDVYYLNHGDVLFSGNLRSLKQQESKFYVKAYSTKELDYSGLVEHNDYQYVFEFTSILKAYTCIHYLQSKEVESLSLDLISLQALISRYMQ